MPQPCIFKTSLDEFGRARTCMENLDSSAKKFQSIQVLEYKPWPTFIRLMLGRGRASRGFAAR